MLTVRIGESPLEMFFSVYLCIYIYYSVNILMLTVCLIGSELLVIFTIDSWGIFLLEL